MYWKEVRKSCSLPLTWLSLKLFFDTAPISYKCIRSFCLRICLKRIKVPFYCNKFLRTSFLGLIWNHDSIFRGVHLNLNLSLVYFQSLILLTHIHFSFFFGSCEWRWDCSCRRQVLLPLLSSCNVCCRLHQPNKANFVLLSTQSLLIYHVVLLYESIWVRCNLIIGIKIK